jgi:hypothetical protein
MAKIVDANQATNVRQFKNIKIVALIVIVHSIILWYSKRDVYCKIVFFFVSSYNT